MCLFSLVPKALLDLSYTPNKAQILPATHLRCSQPLTSSTTNKQIALFPAPPYHFCDILAFQYGRPRLEAENNEAFSKTHSFDRS